MSISVLLAVGNRYDAQLATTLQRTPQAHLVRRCADLADLLAAGATGLADTALVGADLRGLDRSAIGALQEHRVRVIGVAPPQDEDAERHLRQIGLLHVIAADADPIALAEVLSAAVDQDQDPDPDADPDGQLELMSGEAEGSPEPERRRLVAVWGPIGSPGRTTIAVTLAAELADRTGSCLLIDADTYGASIAQHLALLDEAPGLAAATRASDHGTLDLPVLSRLAPEVLPGLRVLTGLPRADRWPELRAPAIDHVLDLGRQLARVSVVDCGFALEDDEELSYDTRAPRRNATTLSTLAAADQVLAVGSGDPIGLQRLVRGLQDLAAVTSAPVLVVVNKVRSAAVGSTPERRIREALLRFAGVEQVWVVPDDRATLDAAMLSGRALPEYAPDSPVRRAVVKIAEGLGVVDEARRRGRGRRDRRKVGQP